MLRRNTLAHSHRNPAAIFIFYFVAGTSTTDELVKIGQRSQETADQQEIFKAFVLISQEMLINKLIPMDIPHGL
jgi:hypothetical protein